MRKLSGIKKGANYNVRVYQEAVRPHLECGSCVWSTATQPHQQKLDRIQNQALRIVTGTNRSPHPIKQMEQLTKILPIRRGFQAHDIQAIEFKSLQ